MAYVIHSLKIFNWILMVVHMFWSLFPSFLLVSRSAYTARELEKHDNLTKEKSKQLEASKEPLSNSYCRRESSEIRMTCQLCTDLLSKFVQHPSRQSRLTWPQFTIHVQ